MQNPQVQEFGKVAAMCLPDTVKRRLVLPYLIGIAIGEHLMPKIGEELSPMTIFADTYLVNVAHSISWLNEEMILDIPATVEATRMTYLMRHRILNGVPADYAVAPEFDFMAAALGLATIMPLDVYEALKESGVAALKVLQAAKLMIRSLKDQNKIAL